MVKFFQKDCVEKVKERTENNFEEFIKEPYGTFECGREKGFGELIDLKESISFKSVSIPFPLSLFGLDYLFRKQT